MSASRNALKKMCRGCQTEYLKSLVYRCVGVWVYGCVGACGCVWVCVGVCGCQTEYLKSLVYHREMRSTKGVEVTKLNCVPVNNTSHLARNLLQQKTRSPLQEKTKPAIAFTLVRREEHNASQIVVVRRLFLLGKVAHYMRSLLVHLYIIYIHIMYIYKCVCVYVCVCIYNKILSTSTLYIRMVCIYINVYINICIYSIKTLKQNTASAALSSTLGSGVWV